MKKLILSQLLLAAMLVSTSAFAGNEGPNAAPKPPPVVIAKATTYIGFRPPNMAGKVEISIKSDGSMTKTESYDDGHQDVRELGTLSKFISSRLNVAAA